MTSPAICWFRRDLRIADNPAWEAAAAGGAPTPLVVVEPGLLDRAGPFRREAFLAAVEWLRAALAHVGRELRVETGDPAAIVPAVAAGTAATAVHANADVTRWSARRDAAVGDALAVPLVHHWGTLVHEPGAVLTKAGTLSRVFTPFHEQWRTLPVEGTVTRPGHRALERAVTRAAGYSERRDVPGIEGTTELSVALRFGTVSPRDVVRALTGVDGGDAVVRQLAWRDWYAHLTAEAPDIDRIALRPEYDMIAWESGPDADAAFAAWTEGRTGYPIVDAGMRQLRATGWMHNRVRMIAASFLVKDLLIDWRRGERWFRHWLADGDIPQNAGNWQWVAGTGPDAAPYFRIFNPTAQSRTFDPDGDYIRRWVPELAGLGPARIHAPWEIAPLDLAAAGVNLGDEYPAPIVDHAVAREETLLAYRSALDAAKDARAR